MFTKVFLGQINQKFCELSLKNLYNISENFHSVGFQFCYSVFKDDKQARNAQKLQRVYSKEKTVVFSRNCWATHIKN